MRAFITEAIDLASRYVGLATLPQFAAGAILLAGAITDEAILTGIAAGPHGKWLHGHRRLIGDLVDGNSTLA